MAGESFWPTRPYKGLRHYTYPDARLFAGRERELDDCRNRLLNSDVSLFVLHGFSGSGKSSFLRAALLPSLEPSATSAGYGSVLELLHGGGGGGIPLVLRAGKRPLHRLAITLFAVVQAWIARRPEKIQRLQRALLGHITSADFAADAGADGSRMFDAFASLSLAFPAKPLLLLDQAEDVFSAYDRQGPDRETQDSQGEFFTFLSLLISSPMDLKLLVSLRTEFKPRFDEELASRRAESTQYASYMLKGMDKKGMLAAVVRPTELHRDVDGIRHEMAYGFCYNEGVPELIVDDLWSNTEPRNRLPVLQVICDRLYSHRSRATKLRPFRIDKSDYWENGLPSAQVFSYLEEAITECVCTIGPSPPADVSMHVDRWHRVLSALCERLPDGVARTRTDVSSDELHARAIDVGCAHVPEILKALQGDETYVLKADDQSGGSPHMLVLVHDTLAVALVRWTKERRAVDAARRETERDPIIVAADLRLEDLFEVHASPVPWVSETINDLIWDHQILLYAEHRGFFRRLGIEFRVPPELDISHGMAGPVLHYKHLLDREPGQVPRTVVLPAQVHPRLLEEPWTRLAVANLYRGYAVLGPKRPDLQPLSGDETPGENASRLMKLAKVLNEPATRVFAFDDQGLMFLNLILKAVGNHARSATYAETDADRSVDVRDRTFAALVEGKAHFAMGPAPSRALALQAGFIVYADFLGIDRLWSQDAGKSDELRQLHQLYMHEDLAVDMTLPETTQLRLLSVLFYTIAHIRLRPDEFVAFLYDQQLRALEDGAYPVRRRFIRDALQTCYEYMPLSDYAFDVLSSTSERAHPHPSVSQREAIRKFVAWRHRCDRLMIKLMRADATRLNQPDVQRQFSIARNHYRIMNYYDAAVSLQRLWAALNGAVATER